MTPLNSANLKIAVVLNGIALHKEKFYKQILPKFSSHFNVDVFETHSKNDAVVLASEAVELQYKIILAAGGDGTLNQVINGVLIGRENYENLPTVGVIPLGSGNDFARGINLLKNPVEKLFSLLQNNSPKPIDIGRVLYSSKGEKRNGTCYFINVSDIGMGPEVVKRVMKSKRTFGSSLEYYKNILLTFALYKIMKVHAITPQWQWSGKLRSLAITNGNYYGHGLCIAPDARPADGIFSAFICGNVSVFDFIRYTSKLKNSKKITHAEIHYWETNHIELESETHCLIEADGELLGELPATIEMAPVKLNFLY
jgi:diacylglycerol kinase (ATP)